MKIYISHSVGCAGWDMEGIFKNTLFKTGCKTIRFKDADIGKVKMLDWDFGYYMVKDSLTKKRVLDPARFEKVQTRHLELVKEYDFEVVMSMDFWKYNPHFALNYADKLLKYTDRVLIPVHDYSVFELQRYNLAYPNAQWYANDVFPPGHYRRYIKHILGGSPQSQIKHLTTTQRDLRGHSCRFPNVESIDGNQIFNVAIQAGKEWFPTQPYWRKPKEELTNEQIFKNSVKRLDQTIKDLDVK